MKHLTRLLILSALLIMLVAGAVQAQDDYKVIVDAAALGQSDVPTLDPSLATDSSSIAVIESITVGLVRLNEITVAAEPGMAESWEISEDGTEYTFTIRQDVPWVRYDGDAVVEVTDDDGNVRMVTANDFAYTIRRTLDPRTGADYAGVLAPWVVGGGELLSSGDAADEDIDAMAIGVEVVDDYTLKLTSPQPAGFLPQIFSLWMTTATPSWLIEEYAEQWYEPENIATYGPFAIKEWNHDENVTLIANPFWPGTDAVPSPAVNEVILLIREQSTALAEFEAGEVDVSPVPSTEYDRIVADPMLSEMLTIGPSKFTYYYGFNVEKEPFTDARVRRAFSMAIDRQAIVDNVTKQGQVPAGMFTRPDIFAGPSQEEYPDAGIYSDPEAAQALFQEYLDEQGITVDELPPITLMFNTSESHQLIAQAVQQMWAETLGVQIELANQEWGVFLETRKTDAPQIFRSGWGWDYPDANSFLYDVFHSTSGNNDTNWTNEDFDALLEEAVLLTDEQARKDLYAQAEEMLTDEYAAIAPVYFYVQARMNSDRIIRTDSVLGNERYEKWDIAG